MYCSGLKCSQMKSVDNAELKAGAQQVFSCMTKKLRQNYCYREESSDVEKQLSVNSLQEGPKSYVYF